MMMATLPVVSPLPKLQRKSEPHPTVQSVGRDRSDHVVITLHFGFSLLILDGTDHLALHSGLTS